MQFEISQKRVAVKFLFVFSTIVLCLAFFCSCSIKNRVQKELACLSDNLLSDYTAQFDYAVSSSSGVSDDSLIVSGSALVSRSDGKTSLSVLSPEPYGGICVCYTASEIPDSIDITYENISLKMPKSAFDKINVAMAMFTDDFALKLRTVPTENVQNADESGLCTVKFEYNGSDIEIRYAPSESNTNLFAESFTVSRGNVTVNGALTGIKLSK